MGTVPDMSPSRFRVAVGSRTDIFSGLGIILYERRHGSVLAPAKPRRGSSSRDPPGHAPSVVERGRPGRRAGAGTNLPQKNVMLPLPLGAGVRYGCGACRRARPPPAPATGPPARAPRSTRGGHGLARSRVAGWRIGRRRFRPRGCGDGSRRDRDRRCPGSLSVRLHRSRRA